MYVTQLYAGHWYICPFTTSRMPSLPRDLDIAYDTKREAEAALAEYHRRRAFNELIIACELEAGRTMCGFIPSFYVATLRKNAATR